MPFTEEQTNRYLEPLRQEFLDHHQEPNAPYTQEITNLVRTEALQQQSIWRREPIEGGGKKLGNYISVGSDLLIILTKSGTYKD